MLTAAAGVSAAHAHGMLYQGGRPCLPQEWELLRPMQTVLFFNEGVHAYHTRGSQRGPCSRHTFPILTRAEKFGGEFLLVRMYVPQHLRLR